jgi:Zn finger protein HypA/HybF involved in hydrogenase expression
MKPKKQKLECEKCWNKKKITKTLHALEHIMLISSGNIKMGFESFLCSEMSNEHLHHTCPKCGNHWIGPVKKEGKKL